MDFCVLSRLLVFRSRRVFEHDRTCDDRLSVWKKQGERVGLKSSPAMLSSMNSGSSFLPYPTHSAIVGEAPTVSYRLQLHTHNVFVAFRVGFRASYSTLELQILNL